MPPSVIQSPIPVTCQAAYNGGRTTVQDASGANVYQNVLANANNVLEIDKSPASSFAGHGLNVNMGPNALGAGINVINAGGGHSIQVALGDRIALGIGANDPSVRAGTIDPSAGGGVAAPEGSLFARYVASAGALWLKTGIGDTAWTSLTAGGAGNTLTGAYNEGGAGVGRTIAAISGAVVITTTALDNNNVLEIVKNPAGAHSGFGVSVTMGATTTSHGVRSTTSGSGNAFDAVIGGAGDCYRAALQTNLTGQIFVGTEDDVVRTASMFALTRAPLATGAMIDLLKTEIADGVASATDIGLLLRNTTPAVSGDPGINQNSPLIVLQGEYFDSTSKTSLWGIQNQPSLSQSFQILHSADGAAFADVWSLSAAGDVFYAQAKLSSSGVDTTLAVTGTDGGLFLKGNRASSSATADVSIVSTTNRTSGKVLSVLDQSLELFSIGNEGNTVIIQAAAQPTAASKGPALTVTGGAHHSLPNSETIDVDLALARTVNWDTAATLALQRSVVVRAVTYTGDIATKVITETSTVAITGPPIASTNITLAEAAALAIRTDNAAELTSLAHIGISIKNTTDATVGVQKYSGLLVQQGSGWKSAATAEAQAVMFASQVQPVQNDDAAAGDLIWFTNFNDVGFRRVFSIGQLTPSTTPSTNPAAQIGDNDAAYTGTAILTFKTASRTASIRLAQSGGVFSLVPGSDANGISFGTTAGALGTWTTAALTVSTPLSVLADTDAETILGRVKLGSVAANFAYFSHFDRFNSTQYALRQDTNGQTVVNAASGQSIFFTINGSTSDGAELAAGALTPSTASATTLGTVSKPWGVVTVTGSGRNYFKQSGVAATQPVIALEQLDITEGFIDFLGAESADTANPISTLTTPGSVGKFVRVELNGTKFWVTARNAPT